MITRIEAYNYRCFRQVDADMGGFRVLTGTNGAGKSTLLDIPLLLADIVRTSDVEGAFFGTPGERGLPRAFSPDELVWRREGQFFGLVIECALPDQWSQALVSKLPAAARNTPSRHPTGLRYELRLEVFNGTQLQVAQEALIAYPEPPRVVLDGREFTKQPPGRPPHGQGLWIDDFPAGRDLHYIIRRSRADYETQVQEVGGGKRGAFSLRLAPDQPALTSVPPDPSLFPAATWLRDFLGGDVVRYEPDWRRLRVAAKPGGGRTFMADGSNLAWLLLDLREDPLLFADWIDQLRLALPGVMDVVAHVRGDDAPVSDNTRLPPSQRYATGYASFAVRYRDGLVVPASGLSEGTLRILALSVIPFLDHAPQLIITEQPEDGLHPRAIQSVFEALQLRATGQVWISTHSPVLLSNVDLADVIVMSSSGDSSVAVRGDQHPGLADWTGSLNPGKLLVSRVFE